MKRITALVAEHAETMAQRRRELAMNFDCAAPQIIGVYCAKMGVSRKDWDKMVAVQHGWEQVL